MMSLAQQIAPQLADDVVFGGDRRSLTASELRATGVSGIVGERTRLAIRLRNPLEVVRALVALDGQVEAILLLSYALDMPTVLLLAEAEKCSFLVTDDPDAEGTGTVSVVPIAAVLGSRRLTTPLITEWLMTTSGTTGTPKIVPHTLRSLARSVYRFSGSAIKTTVPIWGLLYDPTRFAGLQVVLQALIGGGLLVVIDTTQPLTHQIKTLAEQGCTHLSATPTLWRRLLMSPDHAKLQLHQVTLGGETVDQSTLNAVHAAFPKARLSHIYASTEAGVGFSVADVMAGFPLSYLDSAPGNVKLMIKEGILWLRPPVTAIKHNARGIEIDDGGYIRSGDRVEVQGDRVFFLGRENGLINIGGIKVYPEVIEAVIKTVPGVALVQVSAKRSPVTGALVLAEIMLDDAADPERVRRHIQEACRTRLVREAVPAIIRFVSGFDINAAGKLVRTG